MPRSTEDLLARLLAGIERELPRAVALRHRLHAHPELAHAEEWTAGTVAAELPVAARTVAGTGRIARVGPPEGPLVAVRAELDGLPLRERTNAPFSATGETMHACGHDVHMAALVALTRAAHTLDVELRAGGGEGSDGVRAGGEDSPADCAGLPAALLAVFQPSEEAYPSGAQQLAKGELAALAPAAVLGAHLHPELPWGAVALDPGAVNASCDAVEIIVEGEPSHGAYPHHGRDPILALAQIVVALHAQVGRRIDPHAPAVLTVGAIEGGSAENLIPARARARATLRAHRPADRRALEQLVREVVAGVAAAHGCRGRVELTSGEPALENDPATVARSRALLPEAGFALAPAWRSSGSDDFAFFGVLAPLAMAFVGLDGAEGFAPRPLHHPELLPPDGAVGAIARVQAVLYLAAAASRRGGPA
jgi:amidohydrolase